MDASEVGRFGTLRLLKRLEPHKVVASYPVDEEEITFGRDPSCSIRLYYESVSALHCKIIFRERKAFIVVLGTNGLNVDGCSVFPGAGGSPVTVPLPNYSSIEINNKSFQFCYPPKELRQTLIDTPTRPDEVTPDRKRRRKTLRMSMIQSAQVFTPRPSEDPRENLRILKTPIKTPFSKTDRRLSSPLKRGVYIPEEEDEDDEDEDEEDIVLVETNHPKVVEEDRDLVILEQVVVEVPEPEAPPAQRLVQFPIPQAVQPLVQQTPQRRRGNPRASLHKAVLIRSAQRTVMKIEMEMEEERDAEEVEETIEALQDLQEDDEDEDEEPAAEAHVTDVQQVHRSSPVSGWRKSLGLVTGWALGQTPTREEEEQEDDERIEHADEDTPAETPTPEPEEEEEEEFDSEEEQDIPQPVVPRPPKSPHRQRPLGNFMTPQVGRTGPRSHVRYSVGGFTPGGIHGSSAPIPALPIATSGPRRVRVVEPWRVEDIMVPTTGADDDDDEEEVVDYEDEPVEQPAHSRSVTTSPSKRPQVSEAERKAIMERRRSALIAPDSFFGGQVPGSRRMSLFPPVSPVKPTSASTPVPKPLPPASFEDSASTPQDPRVTEPEQDSENEEDAQVLLARMKQMLESVKRRQSTGPRPSNAMAMTPTPKKSGFSLLAPDAGVAPIRKIDVGGSQGEEEEWEDLSDKENDVQPAELMQNEDLEADTEDVDMEVTEVDEHVESSYANKSRRPANLAPNDIGTPSFRGMREMFTVPAALETPRMDGMRALFREERVVGTPALDGVADMLQPPEGWTEETVETVDEPPARPLAKATARRVIGRPASAATAASKISSLRRTAPRTAPPSKSATVPRAPDTAPASLPGPAAPAAARVARRPRGKAVESDAEQDQQEEADDSAPVAKRTRKATASPAPESAAAPSTEKTTRRGRGTKTPTPTPEDPPAKSGTTGRRRAKTPTLPEVEEEDQDSAEVPKDDGAAAGSRVRRSARGKLTIEVKEEDEEESTGLADTQESSAPKPVAARALRGRKPAVPTASGLPRSNSRLAKTASTTKKTTPATTKAVSDNGAPVTGNKENTPEPPTVPEDDPPQASSKPTAKSTVKTKITRTVGRARAASESVVEKDPADLVKGRVVRAKARK